MKTVASILLIVFLSAQTPLGQVFKLPVLIEHFYQHQKQSDISLFSFILDHYSHEHHDADQSEDQQLPFKTVILCSMAFAVVPVFMQADFSNQCDCDQKTVVYNVHAPQQHLCSIFHPPRIAG
jgi:hypothetical protein